MLMQRAMLFVRILILGLAVFAAVLQAHDLQTRVRLEASFVVLEASYEGEEAASYVAVRVQAPEAAGAAVDAYQTGRTDRKGHFVFLPDRPGLWKVTIDDEMGHRITEEVNVTDTASPAKPGAPSSPGTPGRSTGDKLLVGLSLLFGATGLLLAWTSRRRSTTAA